MALVWWLGKAIYCIVLLMQAMRKNVPVHHVVAYISPSFNNHTFPKREERGMNSYLKVVKVKVVLFF